MRENVYEKCDLLWDSGASENLVHTIGAVCGNVTKSCEDQRKSAFEALPESSRPTPETGPIALDPSIECSILSMGIVACTWGFASPQESLHSDLPISSYRPCDLRQSSWKLLFFRCANLRKLLRSGQLSHPIVAFLVLLRR
jgi:hypothetical protein